MNMARDSTSGFAEMPRRMTEIEIEKERTKEAFDFDKDYISR
jgi:hypothetical protein